MNKKRARIKIQPRFKIQYPMKNRYKYTRAINSHLYPFLGILLLKQKPLFSEGLR